MNELDDFYTLKGYSLLENNPITSSMEDYLEMIFRMYSNTEEIRINKLSEKLHVKPSSASKMVSNLKKNNLVDSKRYGIISLTEKGVILGAYLLFRHEVLNQFFCYINGTSDELKQVEKIEHFIDKRTVENMKIFLDNESIKTVETLKSGEDS